jgi:hypothetical protein
MKEQDKESRIDEDVEGHVNLRKDSDEAAKDEGDDDVEGHMHLNAPHKGSHKL